MWVDPALFSAGKKGPTQYALPFRAVHAPKSHYGNNPLEIQQPSKSHITFRDSVYLPT